MGTNGGGQERDLGAVNRNHPKFIFKMAASCPLDSPYPKTPSLTEKRSLYLLVLELSFEQKNSKWLSVAPQDSPYPKTPS